MYAAQHAGERSRPIATAIALAGLCLALERGCDGRGVQKAHMRMARRSKGWPAFSPPSANGDLTVADVLSVEAGPRRDEALLAWCRSAWAAWSSAQGRVRDLVAPFAERDWDT